MAVRLFQLFHIFVVDRNIEYRYWMVLPMAREKFQTLTEQMFYVLLSLRDECCGADIMARIANITHGRVTVGPGTLYNLLESFQETGWIVETKTEGRKRSYLITAAGEQALADEYRRLQALSEDYRSYMGRRGEIEA